MVVPYRIHRICSFFFGRDDLTIMISFAAKHSFRALRLPTRSRSVSPKIVLCHGLSCVMLDGFHTDRSMHYWWPQGKGWTSKKNLSSLYCETNAIAMPTWRERVELAAIVPGRSQYCCGTVQYMCGIPCMTRDDCWLWPKKAPDVDSETSSLRLLYMPEWEISWSRQFLCDILRLLSSAQSLYSYTWYHYLRLFSSY